MTKFRLFLLSALCSGLSLVSLTDAFATQNNQPSAAQTEQKKKIEVPVYTKDDVIFHEGVFLRKTDKQPVNGVLQAKSENGKLLAQTFFYNGMPHGESVTFYENGQAKTHEK